MSLFSDSNMVAECTVFENNLCGVEGGAIKAHRNSMVNITNSRFFTNRAIGADGGAIILEDLSRFMSENNQFVGNKAGLGGGAIMIIDHSSFDDQGSDFIDNIAADNGKSVNHLLIMQFKIVLLQLQEETSSLGH